MTATTMIRVKRSVFDKKYRVKKSNEKMRRAKAVKYTKEVELVLAIETCACKFEMYIYIYIE